MRGLVLILSLCLPVTVWGHQQPESYYVNQWCQGEIELVLPDRTRCDCVTDTHAIEVDFGSKWYQAVGQALYYSLQTGKRAGIALIVESPKDLKYWLRLNSTIEHHGLPIDTWRIDGNDL